MCYTHITETTIQSAAESKWYLAMWSSRKNSYSFNSSQVKTRSALVHFTHLVKRKYCHSLLITQY